MGGCGCEPTAATNGSAARACAKVGGRRIDNGDSYEDMNTVGAAMKASGVPRGAIFLTTKIGDGGLGMGAADAADAVCPWPVTSV